MIHHADRTEAARISTLLPVITEGDTGRKLRYRYMEDLSTVTHTVGTSSPMLLVSHATSAGHGNAPKKGSEELKNYAGEWVALDDGQVIAHDLTALNVLQLARDRGVQKPHILFVEDIKEGVSRLGL